MELGFSGPLLRDYRVPGLRIAGKTGTAEYGQAANAHGALPTHGWFTGFAPIDDPKVVVTVFVEKGSSSLDAAPIGARILRHIFGAQTWRRSRRRRRPQAAPAPSPAAAPARPQVGVSVGPGGQTAPGTAPAPAPAPAPSNAAPAPGNPAPANPAPSDPGRRRSNTRRRQAQAHLSQPAARRS